MSEFHLTTFGEKKEHPIFQMNIAKWPCRNLIFKNHFLFVAQGKSKNEGTINNLTLIIRVIRYKTAAVTIKFMRQELKLRSGKFVETKSNKLERL